MYKIITIYTLFFKGKSYFEENQVVLSFVQSVNLSKRESEEMSFKTENRKISRIFEGQKTYRVPRYQRNYVWNRTNWSELLDDIKFTISESGERRNWSHFLGTIVLNKKHESDKLGFEEYEIIDGQQRLTTIFVIFIAICARLSEIGTDQATQISKNILSTYIRLTKLDGQKQYKFENEEITSEFDEILQTILDATQIQGNSNIKNLYKFFASELSNYDFDGVEKFLNKVLEINIVEITSEEDEEIYNIFEVLNARGQKLKQIELLKNRVMKYIYPREQDVIDKAKAEWNEIEENLKYTKNEDVFLSAFVKCYIKRKSENKDSIYKLIKEEIAVDAIGDLLGHIKKFSASYKAISGTTNTNPFIKYFDLKNNQQIRSILSALHQKVFIEFGDEKTYNSSLQQLRNFFFIFNVTKQTSNKTDGTITEFAYKIYHSQEQVEVKFHISDLLYSLQKFIPSNPQFKDYLSTDASLKYSTKSGSPFKQNPKLVKYILSEIYKEEHRDTYIDCDNLTVEHIYSDQGDATSSSLGNLTLLPRNINIKIGNLPPEEKIKIIKMHSTIEDNKNLEQFLEQGVFSVEKREEWFAQKLEAGDFKFNPEIFGITSCEIDKYKENYEIVKNNEALCGLLKKTVLNSRMY